jgi:hypothetical protein
MYIYIYIYIIEEESDIGGEFGHTMRMQEDYDDDGRLVHVSACRDYA